MCVWLCIGCVLVLSRLPLVLEITNLEIQAVLTLNTGCPGSEGVPPVLGGPLNWSEFVHRLARHRPDVGLRTRWFWL